jgi:hypothetical protein
MVNDDATIFNGTHILEKGVLPSGYPYTNPDCLWAVVYDDYAIILEVFADVILISGYFKDDLYGAFGTYLGVLVTDDECHLCGSGSNESNGCDYAAWGTGGTVKWFPYMDDDWELDRLYNIGAYVVNGHEFYECIATHISAASNEPGVGANWTTYWEIASCPDA